MASISSSFRKLEWEEKQRWISGYGKVEEQGRVLFYYGQDLSMAVSGRKSVWGMREVKVLEGKAKFITLKAHHSHRFWLNGSVWYFLNSSVNYNTQVIDRKNAIEEVGACGIKTTGGRYHVTLQIYEGVFRYDISLFFFVLAIFDQKDGEHLRWACFADSLVLETMENR